jgi:uncharacterized protein
VRLKLREIPDGITAIEVKKPDGSPDLPGFSDIGGWLTLDKTGDVLRVTGRLGYACRLECSRCLGEFQWRGQEQIELYFRPQQPDDVAAVRERDLKADDLSVFTYNGNVLDLWPALKEALELARPLKPLCRQDCQGICHGCGRDLNLEACICSAESGDPRWQALREAAAAGPGKKKPGKKRKADGGQAL